MRVLSFMMSDSFEGFLKSVLNDERGYLFDLLCCGAIAFIIRSSCRFRGSSFVSRVPCRFSSACDKQMVVLERLLSTRETTRTTQRLPRAFSSAPVPLCLFQIIGIRVFCTWNFSRRWFFCTIGWEFLTRAQQNKTQDSTTERKQ